MGLQAKNNLQICFHASANRRKERGGGGGEDVGGRQVSFSSTALTRTFKVNLRSVSVHAEDLEKKKSLCHCRLDILSGGWRLCHFFYFFLFFQNLYSKPAMWWWNKIKSLEWAAEELFSTLMYKDCIWTGAEFMLHLAANQKKRKEITIYSISQRHKPIILKQFYQSLFCLLKWRVSLVDWGRAI